MTVWSVLTRRKVVRPEELEQTDLERCLTAFDLTLLGIGSTLGAGAYVIAGQVARDTAGPAVILSFLLAAVASVLAGLCYAEFGARVPKAGSAYIYTYVTVGELMAFIIGWNLILEYVIGTASVARTFSGYFDNLVGETLIPCFRRLFPLNVHTLAPYADPVAFGIAFLVTILLSVGVKESAKFNNCFTLLNLTVLLFISIAGLFKDDPANWAIPPEQVPSVNLSCAEFNKTIVKTIDACCGQRAGCGVGGFMPFGFAGVIRGAATCFFAFVGFDVIATTGEEAKNPQKSIPIATVLSLFMVFVMYCCISVTLTMMSPYFDLDMMAPFAEVFESHGWDWATYLISAGAVCALSTSLLGAMFPMPRVILAMARDGLLFAPLAAVSQRFHTPILATMLSGTLAGIMAAVFDVDALVEMLSIGTLLAYSLVACCVMLLRYECTSDDYEYIGPDDEPFSTCSPSSLAEKLKTVFLPASAHGANEFSAKTVKNATYGLCVSLVGVGSVMTWCLEGLQQLQVLPWTLMAVFVLATAMLALIIDRQPQSRKKLHFTVPFVPWFPILSMFINVYLMLNLDILTWIRFSVWMAIGLAIYFGYGVRHSSARYVQGNDELDDVQLPPKSIKPF